MIARSCTFSLLAGLLFALAAPAAEIRGIIIKASADKKELMLEARGRGLRGRVMTFILNKDTQVLVGKQPGKLTDLAPGKRVRVVFEDQDGERVAVLITLHAVPPALLPPPQDTQGVSGTLRRVAVTDREIVVVRPDPKGGPEQETTLPVPDDAKITRDQKPIRLEDLREGESVVVQTETKGGKLRARSIQAGARPGTAAPERGDRVRQLLKIIDALRQMKEQP